MKYCVLNYSGLSTPEKASRPKCVYSGGTMHKPFAEKDELETDMAMYDQSAFATHSSQLANKFLPFHKPPVP